MENGSPSLPPSTKRNAFDILAVGAQKAKEKKPLKKSEFIEVGAQETDEDDGFGLLKRSSDRITNADDL